MDLPEDTDESAFDAQFRSDRDLAQCLQIATA
jgi:hypothetical protein